MASNADYEVVECGVHTPREVKKDELVTGEVGWIAASIKSISDVHVGDTVTTLENKATEPLPGYRRMNPMVYCGLYPIDNAKYKDLREALEKIALSDSSLVYEPETSQALGFGFRCGFLGLLHMDVIEERLEREFGLDLIATAPSFFDKLKSCTRGYASFDYELHGYRTSNLTKMDILLNGEVVDALSSIVHKDFAYDRGRIICEKLKTIIPRQQFEIPVQAAIQGRVIARTNIKAIRKNVLAKCYGGDNSRKKKLLEKFHKKHSWLFYLWMMNRQNDFCLSLFFHTFDFL